VEWNGNPLSVTHTLTVLQPPKITSPKVGASFHAAQGEGLSIPCIAAGDPNPKVHWSRRGATAVHRMVLPGDPSVLQLNGVTREDSGEYICQAINSLSSTEVFVHVAIHFKPVIVPITQRVYSGEGARAELSCRVEGYPQPMVTWTQTVGGRQVAVRRDGNHKHTTKGDNIHMLLIRTLSYTEVANFTCRAENEVGVSMAQIEVTGISQPPIVTSPASSKYQDQYNLTMNVESLAPLMMVKLLYRPLGSLEFIERTFSPGNLRSPGGSQRGISYRMERLERSTTYQLLASVMNSYGWSDQGNMFTFTTLDQDYSDHPKSFFDFHSGGCSSPWHDLYLVFGFLQILQNFLID